MASCLVVRLLISAAIVFLSRTVQAQNGMLFCVYVSCQLLVVASSPSIVVVQVQQSLHLKFDPHLCLRRCINNAIVSRLLLQNSQFCLKISQREFRFQHDLTVKQIMGLFVGRLDPITK